MNRKKNISSRPKYRTPGWQNESSAHPLTGTYYDTSEMMNVLHVSDRTLHRWRKEGKIPYTKIGGKIYYLADAVDRKMREGE